MASLDDFIDDLLKRVLDSFVQGYNINQPASGSSMIQNILPFWLNYPLNHRRNTFDQNNNTITLSEHGFTFILHINIKPNEQINPGLPLLQLILNKTIQVVHINLEIPAMRTNVHISGTDCSEIGPQANCIVNAIKQMYAQKTAVLDANMEI